MKITSISICVLFGIFPLTLLPTLPGFPVIAILFVTACVLALIPRQPLRYLALTLLFFLWGILAAKQITWPSEVLPTAIQEAQVLITGTDHMTTHYGQITHLSGKRVFLRLALFCMSISAG